MSCSNCQQSWFWKKIGRCMRCIYQLIALSIICSGIWWFALSDTPKSIQSIALLTATSAFIGLLVMHLWMRWVVIPLQSGKKKATTRSNR